MRKLPSNSGDGGAMPHHSPLRRKQAWLPILIAIAFVLAACNGGGNPGTIEPGATATTGTIESGATATTGEPTQGGRIVYTSSSEPLTMNPAFSPVSTTIYHSQFVFDGLTRPDVEYRPQPSLAESWEVSDDGLEYTFHLREGVTFHDGEPFTSSDVKFTWELVTNPDNAPGAQLASFFLAIEGAPEYRAGEADEISGITLPDDHTVEVRLTQPYGPFLPLSAFQPILPQHVYGDVAVEDLIEHETARAPVGTGPFILSQWVPNDRIEYVANEDYWGGRPYLDELIVRTVPDPSLNAVLLRSGDIDLTGMFAGIPFDEYPTFEGDDSVRTEVLEGDWNRYVEYNLANPLFEDVRVREALNLAIDREGIRDGLQLGLASINQSPVHERSWGWSEPENAYDYDLERAAALLDEAGWELGPDGVRVKDGQRLSFEIQTFAQFASDYPVAIQESWSQLGVDASVNPMDFAAFWAPVYLAGLHDVAMIHVPLGMYTDPIYPLPGYFESALNRNSYENPDVDRLINESTVGSEDERRATLAELTAALNADAAHSWVTVPAEIWGMAADVRLADVPNAFLQHVYAREWHRVGG